MLGFEKGLSYVQQSPLCYLDPSSATTNQQRVVPADKEVDQAPLLP